jgi:redox-sensitive bicupin YhaK (pirin superfamily)
MISIRRSEDRMHEHHRTRETWRTFFPGRRADVLADGFVSLETLDESRLEPGGCISLEPRRDAEIVTCVREGALAYEDSMGRSGVLQTDEFQSMTLCRGLRHKERNASQTNTAHVFQLGMHPGWSGLSPEFEQKRFSTAQRRGRLCVVASPDGRKGSLRIPQDALIYSALLEPGKHVVHELSSGRSAWLHIVHGEVTFGDIVLATGDGVGVSAEGSVSLTAREETEILLIDLVEKSASALTHAMASPFDPRRA